MTDACRICDSYQVTDLQASQGRYLRCRNCHSITRAITADEYHALEPSYDPGPKVANTDPDQLRAFLSVDEKKVVLARFMPKLSSQSPSFLDIGCGAGGYLLAAAELGCKAVGVEPSESHSTVGRALGLDITVGYFAPGMYPEESFDLIMLSHVIEHVYEPRPFLEALFRLVRPGGFLIVITPNADSLVARVTGRHWVMLRPVDHVSMLSEKGFRAMGVESWGEAAYQQSEFVWEPLASIASAVISAVRRKPGASRAFPNGAPPTPAPSMGWRRNLGPVRSLLGIMGLPLHQIAVASNRQACLTLELRKAGGVGDVIGSSV